MLQLLPRNLNVNFIGKWKYAAVMSLLLVAASFYMWFSLGEKKYGTDFTGGHDILVRVPASVTSDTLRQELEKTGLSEASVQSFEKASSEYSIRVGGKGDPDEARAIQEQVSAVLKTFSTTEAGDPKAEILRADYVGPVVGQELRYKALLATGLGIVLLLIYITIRFEFAFALGAVVAVFHDVIIAGGAYLAAGHLLNMTTVAAALTILGYSVNDTIVIFDRVREELRNPNYKDLTLTELINLCINQTMSRTIITSMLTLFSVVALLVFGGGAIQDLAFFLLIGMLAGCYSTIYIAAPVVLAWEGWRRRKLPAPAVL